MLSRPPLSLRLPRLVECFHKIVIDSEAFCSGNELPKEARLVLYARGGRSAVRAVARPAGLGDYDLMPGNAARTAA